MQSDARRKTVVQDFTEEDLMSMDEVSLRSLLIERTHHTIEVALYPTLLRGVNKPMKAFGEHALVVFDIWHKRGLPEDTPDLMWVKRYVAIAEKIRAGEKVTLDEPLPTPFSENEMAVVEKLLYGRRSIRDWLDKPVPDEMIEKILEAGRAAPTSCNLGQVRFVVLKDHEEKKMIWSDVSTNNCVIIVVCYDNRVRKVVGQDSSSPHNGGYDASAAADHMLLMAHALGLGAVWLSRVVKPDIGDTGARFKELYGLPDYIEVALHIGVGWPAMGTIKSQRVPLSDMIIHRNMG